MPLNMRPSGSAVITTQPASRASISSSWPVVRPMMRPSRSTAMSVMPSTGSGVHAARWKRPTSTTFRLRVHPEQPVAAVGEHDDAWRRRAPPRRGSPRRARPGPGVGHADRRRPRGVGAEPARGLDAGPGRSRPASALAARRTTHPRLNSRATPPGRIGAPSSAPPRGQSAEAATIPPGESAQGPEPGRARGAARASRGVGPRRAATSGGAGCGGPGWPGAWTCR